MPRHAVAMLDVSDAQVRLRRAGRLLHSVQAMLRDWLTDEPLRLKFQRDPDAAIDQYVAEVLRPVPEDVAAEAGDFANNVRSALNYAAMAIYAGAGGDPGSDEARVVDFPIAETDRQWQNAQRRQLSRAWPEAIAELQRFQPCTGPSPAGAALLNLQELNNADKHRYLHVVGAATTAVESEMESAIPEGTSYDMLMPHPAGRVDVRNAFLVSRYIFHLGDMDAPMATSAVPRWEGMSEKVPPPPTLTVSLYGQRAISFDELPPMLTTAIEVVSVVERLTPPSAFTS